jgi:hypothetical protein
MCIGAADRLTYRSVVVLRADWISRREDAVIHRAGLSNQAGSLALGLCHKSNNFTHIRTKHRLEKQLAERIRYEMTVIIPS